jgi:hypothetical protein
MFLTLMKSECQKHSRQEQQLRDQPAASVATKSQSAVPAATRVAEAATLIAEISAISPGTRITSTNCCIHTVVPPDDEPRYARNKQRLKKYTNKSRIKLVFLYTVLWVEMPCSYPDENSISDKATVPNFGAKDALSSPTDGLSKTAVPIWQTT